MKLSIAIIVLATIIYGCQCAPYLDWREAFNQQMQDLQKRLREDQERTNQELEKARLEREEYMRRLNEQLETASQNGNGISIGFHNSYSPNGSHIYHRVDDKIINNIREQIVTDYNSASGKTEIKTYKCDITVNSSCIVTVEVKDGPPENFYHSS